MSSLYRNTINRIRKFIRRGGPEYEWVKVGVVFQSAVYPLQESHGNHVTKHAICTREGLMFEDIHDGSFVIYETTSRNVCTLKDYPSIQKIVISNVDGLINLTAQLFPVVQFDIKDETLENVPILPIGIHGNDVIFVRDCGDIASKWLSDYLAPLPKGYRLGYYNERDHKAYLEQNKNDWPIDNPMLIHLKADNRYSMLNLASFDKINSTVECVRDKITEFDFRPNIIIQTKPHDAFKEFSWNEIKINKCLFECTEFCKVCRQSQIQKYFDKNFHPKKIALERKTFLTQIRSQILESTGVTVEEPLAILTIDMKLTCDGGPISKGDPVYFRRKRVN